MLYYFLSRAVRLPSAFTIFTGYNDWKKKKIKRPRLSCEELQQHEGKLSCLLGQPWFARKLFYSGRSDTEGLLHAIHQYREYFLKQQTATMQHTPHQIEPQRSPKSIVSMSLLPVVSACSNDYTKISDVLTSKPDYFPVCVNDFAPSDRYTRRHWTDRYVRFSIQGDDNEISVW